MRELTNSMLNYFLANGLSASQGAAKTLGAPADWVNPKNPPAPGPSAEPSALTGWLYQQTRATSEGFGDPAAVVLIGGTEYQSKAVDFVFDLFNPASSLNPNYWLTLSRHLLTQGTVAVDATVGDSRSLYEQQTKNTRYIFTLVRNNPEKLGIPRSGPVDLDIFLPKAYAVGAFESIWTVEGLGHVYSQRVWADKWNLSEDAHGILMEGQAATLPDKALTMMHAGLGLGLAESLMKQLTPDSGTAETQRVLKRFLKLCRNNSRPGYVGCALESLGLVTRCFNYPMVGLVARTLSDLDETAWEFFWRGAGRALYFSPAHMLQPLFSPWIAAEQEAPDQRVLNILRAGIAWPSNIVNMQTPVIFEDLLIRYGTDEDALKSIANGVAASTTMASDIFPEHPVVSDYLNYVPVSADSRVRDLWKVVVHDPARNAKHRYQPILKAHGLMDQVFRFQDLEELVAGLERSLPQRNRMQIRSDESFDGFSARVQHGQDDRGAAHPPQFRPARGAVEAMQGR